MRKLLTPLFCLLFGLSGTVLAASATGAAPQTDNVQGRISQWDDIERVVVFADVHGAYKRLVSLLQAGELIDENLAWTGGRTHLVSLGDLLDRGPESRLAMDLIIRLQREAADAGGRVHMVLGNHEVMNMVGDLRYVSEAEFAAMEDLGGLAQAFALNGQYGSWLIELPFVIRINNTVFTHGGITTTFAETVAKHGLDQANYNAQASLRTVLTEGARLRAIEAIPASGNLLRATKNMAEEQQQALGSKFLDAIEAPIFGDLGPLWYRGNAACHPLLETSALQQSLNNMGATRAIIGHTPTKDSEVNTRLNSQVYALDTGMLAEVYKGQARGLEIRGDKIRAFGIDGSAKIVTSPPADPITTLSQADYQANTTEAGTTELTFVDSDLVGRFVKLSKRDAKKAIAAYRLDRMLGLHFVPATVQRQVNGKRGIVMAWPKKAISERERQSSGRGRPEYCEQDSDFSLLAAFDALQGKRDRTLDNLLYNRTNWHILATDNHTGFSTDTKLPTYANPPSLPAPMATAIAALTAEDLKTALGENLSSKEIRALLKRRDAILAWRNSGN